MLRIISILHGNSLMPDGFCDADSWNSDPDIWGDDPEDDDLDDENDEEDDDDA